MELPEDGAAIENDWASARRRASGLSVSARLESFQCVAVTAVRSQGNKMVVSAWSDKLVARA